MPYCVNCGYKLAGNEEECPSCGQAVRLSRTTAYQVNGYGAAAGAAGAAGATAAGAGAYGATGANPVPKSYQVNAYPQSGTYAGPSQTYAAPTSQYAPQTQQYGAQPQPQAYSAQTYSPAAAAATASSDKGSVGWWFLGFFFPLIGLILFLVWRTDRRGDARKAGFGALTGTIVQIVFSVLLVIAAAMMSTSYEDYSYDYGYSSGYGHTDGYRSAYTLVIDEQ